MEAELREQQRRDECTGDADQDVADDAKAGAADDFAGEPARDQADEQNDDNAFIRQNHDDSPRLSAPRSSAHRRGYRQTACLPTPKAGPRAIYGFDRYA